MRRAVPIPLGSARAPAGSGAHNGARVFASPLARRIAKEAGFDLGSLSGSGPHGRIIERDVKSALAGGGARPSAAPAGGVLAAAPRAMSELIAAALAGDVTRARAINERLMPLHLRLFVEPNPIAAKWALARMGRIGTGIRLPLLPLSAAAQDIVAGALRESGLE